MGVVGFTDKGRLGGSRPVCVSGNNAMKLREKFVNCLDYLCEGDYYRR